MCLQFSVLGDERFWSWGPQTSFPQLSPSHTVCSVTRTAAPPSWRRSAVVWATFFSSAFLHFLRGKGNRLGFFSWRCSHTGRFELMYHSLRTLSLRIFPKFSGRSFAAGHRPPGRGDVAVGLICVFLSWDWNCWHCWLSGWLCLFLAEVLQVMPVEISGPNSPAMSYLVQLMPAECKPWKRKIKPFLIIRSICLFLASQASFSESP